MPIGGGGVSVLLSLDDQLSAGLTRASSNVDNFTSNINKMIRGVEAARGSIGLLRGDVESATTAFAAFGPQVALAGGIAAGFVQMAKAASEYQKEVLLVQNNTVLSDQATKSMSASILQMSAQTGSALKDLGEGFMRISNFGNDAADSTIILAEANESAVESGAKVVNVANAGAAVMHEYGAAVGQTANYFNTLAEASKIGNTTQQQFVENSSRSIAVAANLGVSFADVAAAMDAMTRHGFDMATANTQVASIMQHIIDPSVAAKKEIQALSKATGVDLVHDFSLAGLQTKGLIGIMDDLRIATAGNQDEIFKLIPALRGGQGALVLSGVGNLDEHKAYEDLTNTMQGMNKPIEEGFERMQKSASYQFSVLKANVTKDAIEIGTALLPLAQTMASIVGAVPSGVVTAGIDFAGLYAATRIAKGAGGLVGKLGSPSDAQFENYQRELDAYEKYQEEYRVFQAKDVASRARFAADMQGVEAAHQEKMTEIMEAGLAKQDAINQAYAIRRAEINLAGAEGQPMDLDLRRRQMGMAQWEAQSQRILVQREQDAAQIEQATARQAAIQDAQFAQLSRRGYAPDVVNAPTSLGEKSVLGKIGSLGGALMSPEVLIPVAVVFGVAKFLVEPWQKSVEEEARKLSQKKIDVQVQTDITLASNSAKGRDNLQASLSQLEEQRATWEKVNESGVFGKQFFDTSGLTANIDNVKKALDDTSPEQVASRALDVLSGRIKETVTYYEMHGMAVSAVNALLNMYAEDATKAGVAQSVVNETIGVARKNMSDYDKQLKETIADQERQAADLSSQVNYFQSLGGSSEDIWRGLFGITSNGNPVDAASQKESLKNLNDFSEAIKKAYSDTQSAVSGMDSKKGIAGLIESSEGIKKAYKELDSVGKSVTGLSDLNSLTSIFDRIRDAEKGAMEELNGFMFTLNETNSSIALMGSMKSGFIEALNAAQMRQLRGTASSADLELIKNAPQDLATLSDQTNKLQQNASVDWNNIFKNFPDFKAADDHIRAIIDEVGGAKNLMMRVDADVSLAKKAIEDLINPPTHYKIIIDAYIPPDNVGKNSSGSNSGGTYTSPPSSGNPGPVQGGDDTTSYGPLGYNPLSSKAYSSIIKSDARGASPLDDPDIYAAFNRAAKESGVDPRLMLMALKMENGYATDISVDLNKANNFAGLGYDHQKGATVGPSRPSNEGGNYAAFADPQDFFNALAKNLSTGDYRQAFISGNVEAIRQRYVAGTANPTKEQKENIDASVAYYQDLKSRYPESTDTSPNGQRHNIRGTRNTLDKYSNVPEAASANGAIFDQAQASLNKASGSVIGTFEWCEKFVDDVIQRATGVDARFGDPNFHIAAAKAGVPGAGTIITKDQAKAGDLVAWGGDINGPVSKQPHIGIYAGDDQYIGTDVNGVSQRGVSGNPYYIRPPESGTANYYGSDASGGSASQRSSGDSAGKASAGDPKSLLPILVNVDALTAKIAENFKTMSGSGIEMVTGQFDKMDGSLKQFYDTQTFNSQGYITDAQKIENANTARLQSVTIESDLAQYVHDVQTGTGDVAADMQKMRDDGGVLGGYVATQADNWNQIRLATADVAKWEKASADLQASRTQQTEMRTVADESLSRGKQVAAWTDELTKHSQELAKQGIQDQWKIDQNRLDDRKTQEGRIYEDAVSAADRQHVLDQRNDDDKLKALERLQITQESGDSELERVLKQRAAGPGSIQTKFQAGEQLSIQIDYDQRQKQNMIDQISQAKTLQITENRVYEDSKYHLQQNHLIATRGFEDEATAMTRNHERQQLIWQQETDAQWTLDFNRRKSEQEATWALQDKRNKEDQLYNLDKQSVDLALKSAQTNLKSWQDMGKASDQMLAAWEKTYPLATSTANVLLPSLGGSSSGSFSRTLSGHAAGGMITTDYARVGEDGPEIISAMGYYVSPSRNKGSTETSSVVNLSVNAYGSTGLSDDDLAEVKKLVEYLMAKNRGSANPQVRARGRY